MENSTDKSLTFLIHPNFTRNFTSRFYNKCDPFPLSIKDEVPVKLTLGLLYSLVFCVSLFGNALVIYVVATNRTMQTVTNLFITNLAISDVVVSLSSLWITPMYMYITKWIWGGPACFLFSILQGGSIFISTFTLAAIAIDRYVVIVYPFKARIKVHVSLVIIVSIWVAALLLVAPLVLNTKHLLRCGHYSCVEKWTNREMRRTYGMIVLVLQYGVPFLFIFVCYLRISERLKQRASNLANARSVSRQECELHRKRRLNKMLISMVVIFAICWLPLNILNILRDAVQKIAWTNYFPLIFLIGHLFGMSATCWNPILYAWMNENFRREFQAVLPCFPRVTRVTRVVSRQALTHFPSPRLTLSHPVLSNNSVRAQMAHANNNSACVASTPIVGRDRRNTYTNGEIIAVVKRCPEHLHIPNAIQLTATVNIIPGEGPETAV